MADDAPPALPPREAAAPPELPPREAVEALSIEEDVADLDDAAAAAEGYEDEVTRTVNGTGHTGPSEFCATSI